MIFQGFLVVGYRVYPLREVETDAREAVFVKVDFLMIGDLTDITGFEEVSLSCSTRISKTRPRWESIEHRARSGENPQYGGRGIRYAAAMCVVEGTTSSAQV